jgi:hypothetical protein
MITHFCFNSILTLESKLTELKSPKLEKNHLLLKMKVMESIEKITADMVVNQEKLHPEITRIL